MSNSSSPPNTPDEVDTADAQTLRARTLNDWLQACNTGRPKDEAAAAAALNVLAAQRGPSWMMEALSAAEYFDEQSDAIASSLAKIRVVLLALERPTSRDVLVELAERIHDAVHAAQSSGREDIVGHGAPATDEIADRLLSTADSESSADELRLISKALRRCGRHADAEPMAWRAIIAAYAEERPVGPYVESLRFSVMGQGRMAEGKQLLEFAQRHYEKAGHTTDVAEMAGILAAWDDDLTSLDRSTTVWMHRLAAAEPSERAEKLLEASFHTLGTHPAFSRITALAAVDLADDDETMRYANLILDRIDFQAGVFDRPGDAGAERLVQAQQESLQRNHARLDELAEQTHTPTTPADLRRQVLEWRTGSDIKESIGPTVAYGLAASWAHAMGMNAIGRDQSVDAVVWRKVALQWSLLGYAAARDSASLMSEVVLAAMAGRNLWVLGRHQNAFDIVADTAERAERARKRNRYAISRETWRARCEDLLWCVLTFAANAKGPENAERAACIAESAGQDALAVLLRVGVPAAPTRPEAESVHTPKSPPPGQSPSERPSSWDRAQLDRAIEHVTADLESTLGAALELPTPDDRTGYLYIRFATEADRRNRDLLGHGQSSPSSIACIYAAPGRAWEAMSIAGPPGMSRLWNPGTTKVPRLLQIAQTDKNWLETFAAMLPRSLITDLNDGLSHLVVVTDGGLASLPWAALPIGAATLCDLASVSVVPSITTTAILANRLRTTSHENPVVFHAGYPEAAGIRTTLPPNTEAADGNDFLARLTAGAGLVVAAVHADNAVGLDHAMYLHDGTPISASTIMSTNLTGPVWLASCWAARPAWTPGAEPWGLAAAFLAAGAPAVVGATWPIPRLTVAELTATAIPHLLAGEPTAEALRNAQRRFRQTHPAAPPSAWATLTCLGAGNADRR